MHAKALIWELLRTASDAGKLGPGFLMHDVGRATRAREMAVRVRGLDRKVVIRPCDSDASTISQIFARGEYDLDEMPIGRRVRAVYDGLVASGQRPVIVDAGANIGAATLWFHRAYPAARISAIEPDPGSAAILRKNTEDLEGVTVFEAAVASRPGFVSLTSAKGQSWGNQTTRAESGCPIVTMDEAFRAHAGGVPFIAKIDIEGFEAELFEDNLGWLDQVSVVIIEPHDWMFPGKSTSRSFQAALGARPFELFLRGENIVYVRT